MPTQYKIELSPPDITPYKMGNTGVDYAHVLDSGRPGPNVMIQALTHGNEICGAIALDYLFREGVKPKQGKLTLTFANVEAFSRFDYKDPDRSRYVDEDYNRVWADAALNGPRDSVELRRARALRPLVDAADLLLDLHSMHEPCEPIMVCGTIDKNANFAKEIGVPRALLLDTGHPAGLHMIERGGFGDPKSSKKAVLIECGHHWEKRAADVAIDTALRFLAVTGTVEDSWAKPRLRLEPVKPQRVVRVTEAVVAQTANFRFATPWDGLEVVPKAGSVVATDGDRVWKTPYDNCVMVMPSLIHLKPGTTMVRLGRYSD